MAPPKFVKFLHAHAHAHTHTHTELEGFFYSVVSLFHIVTPDEANGIVESLCAKIASEENQENITSRIKL